MFFAFQNNHITIPTELLKTYYQMEHRVITPPNNSDANITVRNQQLVAGMAANFASLGYRLDEHTVNSLLTNSEAEILSFYQTYLPIIQDEIGIRFNHANLFYPGFPEQVAELDRAQIILDQIIYGLSGFHIQPAAEHQNDSPEYQLQKERAQKEMPFLYPKDPKSFRLIQSASPQQLIDTFNTCLQSIKPFTNSQRQFIEQMIDLFAKNHVDLSKVLPTARENLIPCRENKAVFTAITVHSYPEVAAQFITDTKDVLRTAAVLSNMRKEFTAQTLAQAATLPKDVHFNLNRKDRRFFLQMLESQATQKGSKTIIADMWTSKELWKRFFKETHEREYSKQFPSVDQLHTMVANNMTPHERFSSQLEKAISENNRDRALSLLSQRPGELFRRADKLIRIAETQGSQQVSAVIDTLDKVTKQAGISTVVSVSNLLQGRDKDETNRYVSYMYNGARQTITLTEDKWRKALNPDTMKQLQAFADKSLSPEGLAPRFTGKELGKMYISPEMQYYTVPMSTRELSEGIETFGHGSAIDAKSSHDIKRLFVQWTNLPTHEHDSRLDIDLSARVIFDDHITNIGWNADYYEQIMDNNGKPAIVYSGDVQNGGPSSGPGAAEYIDINVPVLKENGAKYIIASVNSYTMQGYDKQPNTYFGWMDRDKQDMGKAFEPQSVQQRFKLTSKSTMENALVYDLAHDRIVWIDEPSIGRVMTERTQEADQIIQNTLSKVMTVEDLAKANAIANEGQTEDLDEAEIVLITRQEYNELSDEQRKRMEEKEVKIIFPSNLLALTTLLLADGVQKLEREHDRLHVAIPGHDMKHHVQHERDELTR